MKWLMTTEELCQHLRTLDAPCRETDDRIWRWVNEQKLNPRAPGWQYDLKPAPYYTLSRDAARSLSPMLRYHSDDPPQPMDYVLEHQNGGLTIGARVGTADRDAVEFGANDAIAISRASLVAHIRLAADGLESLVLTDTPLEAN